MSVYKPDEIDSIAGAKEKKVKDKETILFNPITGEMDMSLKFNADRIVTHTQNMIGNDNVAFDPCQNQYYDLGPLVVTDNDGNVILTNCK